MDIVRLLSDLLTKTVFKLISPNSTSMVVGLANQIVNMLKNNFKDDIREFMKKLAVGVVLIGVGTAAIISSFRLAEEIIRPLPDGPWIILTSYIVISLLCVGGIFFLFKKDKPVSKLRDDLRTEMKTEKRSSIRTENYDTVRETQGSPNFSEDIDVQSALKNILYSFTESFAHSYKKSEKDHTRSHSSAPIDADGDLKSKAYEDVETPYYKRPYESDAVSNSRK